MHKKFKKEMNSLPEIFDFIREFIKVNRIDDSSALKLNLIVEEIFTNFVKYNKRGQYEILVNLQKDRNKIAIQMTDFDVESFDVTKVAAANIRAQLHRRKVGGLGLHLIKQVADEIKYEYKNRNSTITLAIKTENEHVSD